MLALAADLNLQRIVIACDAEQVRKQIREGTKGIYSAIIQEIVDRSRDFAEVSLIHEGRASNFEAHNFVRSTLSLDRSQ